MIFIIIYFIYLFSKMTIGIFYLMKYLDFFSHIDVHNK